MVRQEFRTIFLASVLLPVSLGLFFTTDTTGWDLTTLGLWALMPILVVVIIVLKMAGRF